jgi:hypothetical protein
MLYGGGDIDLLGVLTRGAERDLEGIVHDTRVRRMEVVKISSCVRLSSSGWEAPD